jgi:hypothetical protein
MKTLVGTIVLVAIYTLAVIYREAAPLFYLAMQFVASLLILLLVFVVGLLVFAVLALFLFKDSVTHKPGQKKFAWLVQVEKNRQTIIDREGHPLRVITGGVRESRNEVKNDEDRPRSPVLHDLLAAIFSWYEGLAFTVTGLYAYVPYFTKPREYPLPRLELDPNGKLGIIKPENPKYISNHVRNALTTWFFEYKGIDIQSIPFKVTGAINYSIDPEKTVETLYRSDSWNILLDQVCSAIMRSYLKNNGTIDKVLGKPSEELYGKDTEADMDTDEMAKATCEQIVNTVLEVEKNKETGENNEKRLADFGIRVSSIKIVDISPEITDERELQALRSAVIRRANARGIALEGKGEASAQKSILDVHKDNDKEISSAIINGRALEGASTGGSTIDALVSSFTQNKQRDNQAKK